MSFFLVFFAPNMIRKHFISTLMVMSLFACTEKKEPIKSQIKVYENLYEQALGFKDGPTAIMALNRILLLDSSNLQYSDSLAGLYIKTGNYNGGLQLAQKVFAADNSNYRILELMGLANQQLGNYPEAVGNFNRLFEKSGDPKYRYQVATLYFESEDFGAADSISTEILARGRDTSTIIEMSPAGVLEQVPIEAACYNLKAMIEAEGKSNFNQSVDYLRKALEIYPEFQFPQMYIQRIQQYQQMMRYQGGY
jgi:tetratricopeptide (TPR) repeat protein